MRVSCNAEGLADMGSQMSRFYDVARRHVEAAFSIQMLRICIRCMHVPNVGHGKTLFDTEVQRSPLASRLPKESLPQRPDLVRATVQ